MLVFDNVQCPNKVDLYAQILIINYPSVDIVRKLNVVRRHNNKLNVSNGCYRIKNLYFDNLSIIN